MLEEAPSAEEQEEPGAAAAVLAAPGVKLAAGAQVTLGAQVAPDSQVGVRGDGVVPWVLSAKSARALRGQAARLLAFVRENPGLNPLDLGFSLAARSTFAHRAVVIGEGREELLGGLGTLADGAPGPNVVTGAADGQIGAGAVFLFPGQGSQWTGMALDLLDASPVFAEGMRACEEALRTSSTGRSRRCCAESRARLRSIGSRSFSRRCSRSWSR